MLPFRLDLLGTPVLTAPDGETVRFRTRKHLALLIYLAVEPPGPHRRDRLATLLWPGADIDEARHSLATALSVIRGKLGPDSVDSLRDTVTFRSDRLTTDLDILLGRDEEARRSLAVGRFLDEFEINGAPDFNQWVESKRLRLLSPVHELLSGRIATCRENGDSRRMEVIADQLFRLDDLSETAARARMEARAMAGDRIGAIRVFDDWAARLDDQLGASPSTELAALANRLRRRGVDRVALSGGPTQPVKPHRPERIFVGRSEEHAIGRRLWAEVCARREPRHMLVRGESGIGKSALVERLSAAFSLDGAATARVRCHALERELPFGMASSIVVELLDLPGAAGTAPFHLAELARVVPKVRERFPGLPPANDAVGESARILFTEGVLALAEAIADEQPLALIVDDIDLADATSIGVLHLLMRRLGNYPVMVMLTASDKMVETAPEARRFVDRPGTLPLAMANLVPLNQAELGELLDHLLIDQPDPGKSVRRALVAGSRGNPMVLELLVEDWHRRGQDSVAIAMGAMAPGVERPTPELLGTLVEGVLGSLDQDGRAAAELAAVLGHRLGDLQVYSLVDLPIARAMRALASLISFRLLREANGRLEFTNEIVRANCYLTMPAQLRQMLHTLVADYLINHGLGADPERGLEIAWHLVRADRLKEAVPYLLTGGRSAIRRGTPHEAEIALVTGIPALAGSDKCAAALLYAEALQELGRWEDLLDTLSIEYNPMTDIETAIARVFAINAKRSLGALSHDDIVAETNYVLTQAESTTDGDLLSAAISVAIRLLHLTKRMPDIARLADIIATRSIYASDQYHQIHIHFARAWLATTNNDLLSALDELHAGSRIASERRFRGSVPTRMMIGVGNTLAALGRYAEAEPHLIQALELAKNLDNTTLLSECAHQLTMIYGRLGNHTAQVEWARIAISHQHELEWGAGSLGAHYELGMGLAILGYHSDARLVAIELVGKLPPAYPEWLHQGTMLSAADILAASGAKKQALAHAKKAIAGNTLVHIPYAGQYARWIAYTALEASNAGHGVAQIASRFAPLVENLHKKDLAEYHHALSILESSTTKLPTEHQATYAKMIETLPKGIATAIRTIHKNSFA